MIETYYKLRKELEELKGKKVAQVDERIKEQADLLDQVSGKRRNKNDRREEKTSNESKRHDAPKRASLDLEVTMKNT